MKKVLYAWATCMVSLAVICVTLLLLVIGGFVNTSPYIDVVSCSVVGDTYQSALGDVFTLTLDKKTPVKIQKSACFNMNSIEVGDTFKVVVVYDDKDVLQSITRVTDSGGD